VLRSCIKYSVMVTTGFNIDRAKFIHGMFSN
jgi:hypothetical protein